MSKENIGFALDGISFTDLDYVTFYWIWTGNLLDCDFELHLLDTTGLRLKNFFQRPKVFQLICVFFGALNSKIPFILFGQVKFLRYD